MSEDDLDALEQERRTLDAVRGRVAVRLQACRQLLAASEAGTSPADSDDDIPRASLRSRIAELEPLARMLDAALMPDGGDEGIGQ